MPETIHARLIEEEMKESYVDYAMSVITSRAIPDVRDGLKPVHRRILFAMDKMGIVHNKPSKKSARIVGDVLGKYHPHGDTAVYDSMVRLAQDFSLRYPLIIGQGNFGSVDGDRPAAMRYTEAKLHKRATALLNDIDKETVDFRPNFDGSMEEPVVLPAVLPNLLLNGSTGIAVGMATNIPPHNLNEVTSAIIAYINDPTIGFDVLLDHVQAPDFPTGGILCGTSTVKMAYRTGRGKAIVKAKTHVENNAIIVTEIPYMVNKSNLVETIASLVKNGVIGDISDLRDESDRKGMRIVIELKKNADPELVLNQLLKHSQLKTNISIILLALHDGKPQVMNLKDIIKYYVAHRREVVTRRTQFDLRQAQDREHLLTGLKIALENIDPVVQLIKQAENAGIAKQGLIENYSLSEKQATAILDMKLQRLTSLETQKILEEREELLKKIIDFKAILESPERIDSIIISELETLKEQYGDERRTEIAEEDTVIDYEDLVKEQAVVVNVTNAGYIKQLPLESYKVQKRGGKGVQGTKLKDEDFVRDIFVTSNRNTLLFFSTTGNVYWLKAYQLPVGSRYARGKAIVNLLNLKPEEHITAVLPVGDFNNEGAVMMATKKGVIKKTSLKDFSRPRKGGIRAIGLHEHDALVGVRLVQPKDTLILATSKGNAVKFNETDARAMGRTAAGVRGVTLASGDHVVSLAHCNEGPSLFTITEHGYGKRTALDMYRLIRRGGKGVRNIITSPRNGNVVDTSVVQDDDELILMSEQGVVIRTRAGDISSIGRNTQGVRIMKLQSGDKVVSVAKIRHEE